jgi:hypothetical protein
VQCVQTIQLENRETKPVNGFTLINQVKSWSTPVSGPGQTPYCLFSINTVYVYSRRLNHTVYAFAMCTNHSAEKQRNKTCQWFYINKSSKDRVYAGERAITWLSNRLEPYRCFCFLSAAFSWSKLLSAAKCKLLSVIVS